MATWATVLWPAPPAEYFLGDKSVNPNLVRYLVKMGKTAQFHLQLEPIAKHADFKNVWVSEWILLESNNPRKWDFIHRKGR